MEDKFWNSDKMQQMYFDRKLSLDDMSKQDLAVLLTDLVDSAEVTEELELLDECFEEMQKFNDFPVEIGKLKLFERVESKIEATDLPKRGIAL